MTPGMARVRLSAALRPLADGNGAVEVAPGRLSEVLGALEEMHPRLEGWIRDEQGDIRRHVNVFVNGERRGIDHAVGGGDDVYVLPAISGGN